MAEPEPKGAKRPAADATTETLKEIAEAFKSPRLDGIMAFFTEDAIFEAPKGSDPWGRRFAGKTQVREGFAARFAGLPDVQHGADSHSRRARHAKDSYWKIVTG